MTNDKLQLLRFLYNLEKINSSGAGNSPYPE